MHCGFFQMNWQQSRTVRCEDTFFKGINVWVDHQQSVAFVFYLLVGSLVPKLCLCACSFLAPWLLFLVLYTLFCRMFYFFFESRNSKKDPIVIWLTGGPGCSSELAMFYENGPFKIANNLSLVWNEYGWDKVCLFVHVNLWLNCISSS